MFCLSTDSGPANGDSAGGRNGLIDRAENQSVIHAVVCGWVFKHCQQGEIEGVRTEKNGGKPKELDSSPSDNFQSAWF